MKLILKLITIIIPSLLYGILTFYSVKDIKRLTEEHKNYSKWDLFWYEEFKGYTCCWILFSIIISIALFIVACCVAWN